MKYSRYSTDDINSILELYDDGLSGRQIADKLNMSKSGVNSVIKKHTGSRTGPKVLFLDVENAPSVAVAFQRFKVNITPDHVLDEGGWLLSIAWGWLGSDTVHSMRLSAGDAMNRDDMYLVYKLGALLAEADIVVAHNGKKFDLPLVKTRMLANGLPPPKPVKIIDTLLIARSLSFNSNKLDSLCHALDIGRKMKHHGIRLWIECMQGNEESLKTMEQYNRVDIDLLRELYLEIRGFDPNPPNFGLYYNDEKHHCPACGSTNLMDVDAYVYTTVNRFTAVRCMDCGHNSRKNSPTTSKEKRQSLLRKA